MNIKNSNSKSNSKIVITLCALLAFANISADVGYDQSEVVNRVNSMNVDQLSDQRDALIAERSYLLEQDNSTQSPVKKKEISNRLDAIGFELSQIQKVLLGIGGAALISSLSDSSSPDTVPPILTVSGSLTITLELGDTYTDAGATARDANDGPVTVTTVSNVDSSAVGTYTITYTATDAAGNTVSSSRTVTVVDTTAPTITIAGDELTIVELGAAYTDAGATATDASGAVTVTTTGLEVIGTIPSVGSYDVVYSSTDTYGNTSSVTRTVQVADTTGPTITIAGDALTIVELGAAYTDAGATATDVSGAVTVTTTGLEVIGTIPSLGSYDVVYSSTDTYGNTSSVTRTVQVASIAPVFTSQAIFNADENQTVIGTVTATDATAVTFTISGSELSITTAGVLTFVAAPDFETKSTYTATVTATDTYSAASTQDITVNVNDVGGWDDNPATGTGTDSSVGSGSGSGTGSGTGSN